MKILVTGGTGFIGSAIVDELHKNSKYDVGILTRNPLKVKPALGKAVQGDVTDLASLKRAVIDFDGVIHCVQFPNHPVQNPKKGYTYEHIDAEGTENLCQALKGSSVKRIVYLSGAGTTPEKTQSWFRAKLRAEKAIKESGIDYVILRPSMVYGPNDRSLNKFISFAKTLPVMPVIGTGEYRLTPLFIEDLAKICVKSLESEAAKNLAIEVGGPETMTMAELQKLALELVGKNKPLFRQPKGLVKFASAIAASILSTPPLSPEAVEFITMDVPVDSKQAAEIFQMKFKDVRSAVRTYLK
jgi:nucleoside-diphosphate-sugar epimerase